MCYRYTSITCPEGYAKLSPGDFAQSCESRNLTCPHGSDCMCSPCKALIPQPDIPYQSFAFEAPGGDTALMAAEVQLQSVNNSSSACQRMEVCATFNVGSDVYLMVSTKPYKCTFIAHHIQKKLCWFQDTCDNSDILFV